MILSAEFFDRVLKTFKNNETPSDKRAAARIGIRTQVRITRCEGKVLEPAELVWTRDISRGGIGILSSKPMKIGQLFVLELPSEEDDPVRIVCQTRCRRRIDGELYVIGAAFQRPPENLKPSDASRDTAESAGDSARKSELIQRIKSNILR